MTNFKNDLCAIEYIKELTNNKISYNYLFCRNNKEIKENEYDNLIKYINSRFNRRYHVKDFNILEIKNKTNNDLLIFLDEVLNDFCLIELLKDLNIKLKPYGVSYRNGIFKVRNNNINARSTIKLPFLQKKLFDNIASDKATKLDDLARELYPNFCTSVSDLEKAKDNVRSVKQKLNAKLKSGNLPISISSEHNDGYQVNVNKD